MRKFIKTIVCLVVLAMISGSLTSCFLLRNPDVHIVLPENYVGLFKVVLDESGGTEVEKQSGRYVYEIPEDGVLKVKSFAPFYNMHKETASYKDGTKIPTEHEVKEDTVAMRNLGMFKQDNLTNGNVSVSRQLLLVGTKKQANDALKQIIFERIDEMPLPIYNERFKQTK